jgi:hypothetical protein
MLPFLSPSASMSNGGGLTTTGSVKSKIGTLLENCQRIIYFKK